MFDESEDLSPINALVALTPIDHGWQPILHVSGQVVLYNPTSHALSIRTHSRPQTTGLTRRNGRHCPYCHRFLPDDLESEHEVDDVDDHGFDEEILEARNRVANYFQLLEIANGAASRPITPTSSSSVSGASSSGHSNGDAASARADTPGSGTSPGPNAFRAENMAEGYFKAFFKEECKLGMGANGSVFLCQHVLDGNPLGYFAVKKIAVGQSHSYLIETLREVRLLEKLHHPNIITYHHAWLETCQFSSFGPKIPTLHVLMQWAEGGSLDDFIEARLGRRGPAHLTQFAGAARATSVGADSASPSPQPDPDTSPPPTAYSRTARIRAFRALQRASPAEKERLRRELGLSGAGRGPADWKAVHLLSAEEVKGLFGDVVAGIAFLHEKSILHLDLKPGNVLLTWDDGKLIPRAMLSDFGTSHDMLKARPRSGNTGTLEYAAPESLPAPSTGILHQVDSKADMWSVGMILHRLLFFRLPYHYASDGSGAGRRDGSDALDALENEVANYAGFKSSPALATAFESRRLPRAYLVLLESLLNKSPTARPSSERVLVALREGRLNPLIIDSLTRSNSRASLVSVTRRRKFGASSTTEAPVAEAEVVLQASCLKCADGSLALTAVLRAQPSISQSVKDRTEDGPLGLPAPSSPTSPNGRSRWCGRTLRELMPSAVWVRTLKSLVLILKVRTLSTMCPETRPHPLVVSLVLALAVIDTWFDRLPITLILGVTHIALMYLACNSGRPCVQA